jgi:hypothetical protein
MQTFVITYNDWVMSLALFVAGAGTLCWLLALTGRAMWLRWRGTLKRTRRGRGEP